MKNKKNGIDLLRGIAAFGIVGCHLGLFPRTTSGILIIELCDFNVGLFAAISGFLMPNQIEWEYVKKRAKRLLPTYFFWSLFYVIVTAIYDLVLDGGQLNERYYSLSNWIKVIFCGSASAHLWFLISLFYMQTILVYFIKILEFLKTTEKIKRGLIIVISIIFLYFSFSFNNWYCYYPIRLIAFLTLGYIMKDYTKNWVIIPLIGIIIMIVLHFVTSKIIPGFLRDYLLVIPVMMLFVSNIFKENKFAIFLAGTSMGIYLVHPIFARGASFVIAKILSPPYDAFIVFCEWIVVWVISLSIVLFLKKKPCIDKYIK